MDPEAKVSSSRRRDLPPIPQGQRRTPRALPSMPSQDTAEEMPAPKSRKKKAKRDAESVDEPDDGGMEMGGLASRRQSECPEPLTPEPLDNPPQRRKKKKKAQAIDAEGDQTDLVSNGDTLDQNTDEEVTRKPKKRKVKPKVTETQSNNELDVEDDDVITDPQSPIPQHSLFSAPQGPSQPVGKVFVEKSRRFQAADRVEQWKPSGPIEQSIMDIRSMWTTRDVSMRVHSGFRVIGLFSHGFLAGYAVWNIIVVYVLAGDQMSSLSNLLQQFHTLAYPAQSLLYLLLALSTVSAFDRVNLAKAPAAMRSLLRLSPVALASVFYFSALVLSLSQQMTSDRINLYKYSSYNTTLWPPGSESSILYPWITVNLVVSLLVGLAWILMSTSPDIDNTEAFLMSMEMEYPNSEEKGNVTA
ncbi:transmembrane protein 237B [Danio rerio]|uniref:Transmembrane protein 237B n=1 Tax=Danio rerio TaxID=7955 RepID=T237B_DANRE|nr:transmembrane protein 237B [Danio rerio]Q66IE4.1 RecName: Full=Transmembrane protein 237B; AltName: Full=Amyotrophic lateral sclerosis 2 chromosomal region candidate gene 4 protein homolog B [Danio rerio]AAH81384.1 Zgc:101660 [Danio rerio]|eukprot:NP_001004636.1 transmembrane protein 237B [Danio rerio]